MKNKKGSRYRWFVVAIFFFFMLLHQSDKLLIGPLTPDIMKEFQITKTQMGSVLTGALIVGTVLYPVWGYLYDRYSRSKLLALASFIWGSTTWISALAQTFPIFRITRASTGIDDSSYPGLFSLIADYFGPNMRGKVYGLLQLTQPLGYLIGMILALLLSPTIGWRSVFFITGSLGIFLTVVIFFGVKEMPRGKSEPEFDEMSEIGQYKFSWAQAKEVFKKRTMWFIFLQGFVGVIPWNVIIYWFFTYLAEERGYDQGSILSVMAPVILFLAVSYFIGGAAGDWLFKKTNKGRIIISSAGVILGALFLFLAIQTPVESKTTFFVFMILTALFMPLSSPNVIATVYDITMPEVRSTAQAVEYFIENFGAAFAPLIAGIIADATNLKTAILTLCIISWVICFFLYLGALVFINGDINSLRKQMAERADFEKNHQPITR
jgi:MFS transporter, Spinster family, sphingosine-1-phosphate transporter